MEFPMTVTEPPIADNPGTLVRPPRLYLAGLLLGGLLEYLVPSPNLIPELWQFSGAGALIGVGLGIAVKSFLFFDEAGTNVPTVKPTTAIVQEGPYQYSRNPIYAGMTLFYIGVASAFESWWMLGFLVPILAVMHFGVILREERYLEAKFGDEYLDYKRRVRRWF
jgi:protein-S-isoprenylcysteine O-methyltransferase Ste14